MNRVIIICEGETEKEFCNKILAPYFATKEIYIQSPLIKKTMGGIVKWPELKNQILLHLKSDPTSYVTTLIDYYGIYKKFDFPNWETSEIQPDKNKRMEILEEGMHSDIKDSYRYRYIPYIQLHEFEGLLFNNIKVFHEQIPPDDLIRVNELEAVFSEFDNPEMINNHKDTAPSKRLKRIIRGYNKIVYGNILAESIGLERLREKSPRFNFWLNRIEKIRD
ncbi:DUF4276 family protein [Sinomicrobium oceani]|uniref:DUF4276 family protein n=1 Tax=Sinomicrobium oceani TaxID=1150368 RepID=UPI00227A2A18|nr:DUF4276 family protein [Sinomicrobium oceani]